MENIIVHRVENLNLVMPKFMAINWPSLPLDEFPNFCGAGSGIGEILVPDTFYGLSMRHNCYIHDGCFTLLPPNKKNWHLANSIMLINNLTTIRERGNRFIKPFRNIRAMHYFEAVESNIGWRCFTDRTWINNYDPYKDEVMIELLVKVGVSADKGFNEYIS
jgi:hypothetical protein